MADPTPAGAPASDPAAAAAASGTPAAGSGQAGTPAAGPSVDEIRAQAAAEFAAGLKAATGFSTLSEMAAAKAKADADALAEQGKYRELAEQTAAKLAETQAAYHRAQVAAAIAGAAGAAHSVDVVQAMLAGQAQVGPDGAVTIGGKSPAEAVTALLQAHPYLARPVAGQGSGAGATGTGAGAPSSLSMAQLDELRTKDPAAYRAEITRRARGA